MKPIDREIIEIQKLYPRIYMACHVNHVRAATSGTQLSSRDSAILAHLPVGKLTTPTNLARHLGISLPTLSEAMTRLLELGYVKTERDPDDERKQRLSLTPKGVEAMSASSVLDSERLRKLLLYLGPKGRRKVIDGLAALADAAVAISSPRSRSRDD